MNTSTAGTPPPGSPSMDMLTGDKITADALADRRQLAQPSAKTD